MIELKALKYTCEEFGVSHEALLQKGKRPRQNERIARAVMYYAIRQAHNWTYREIGEAYGVSLTIPFREVKWLESFIDSSYVAILHKKALSIVIKLMEIKE